MLDLKKELIELKRNNIIKQYEDLQENIKYYLKRIEDQWFKIAVVGEFSTGKSTFINSIIGKDVLTHAKQETTANITLIRNVDIDNPNYGKCRIKYYDGREQWLDSFENISEYTTTASKISDVAAEIEYVDLFVHFIDTKNKLVLVDTPGLNGTSDRKLRDITVSQIKQANACVVLFPVRGVTESSLVFLKEMLEYQHYYIFVLNQIDSVHEEEESRDDKVEAFKAIIEEKLFKEMDSHVRRYYCGMSSLWALVGRDDSTSISKDLSSSKEPLGSDKRKELFQQSRYEDFANILAEVINDKEISKKIYQDQCMTLLHLLDEAITRGTGIQQDYEEKMADSGLLSDEQRLKSRLEQLRTNREKLWKRVVTAIEGKMAENARDIRKKIETDLMSLSKDLCDMIDTCKDYGEFDNKNKSGVYKNEIMSGVSQFKANLTKYKNRLYQASYREVVASLDNYAAWVEKSENVEFQSISADDSIISNFKNLDKIKRVKKDMAKLESEIKTGEKESLALGEKLEKARTRKKEFELAITKNEESRTVNIKSLGLRPSEVKRTKKITEYVERGGIIGWLKDIFCEPKKITREVPYYDDTEGRAWDKEKEKIEKKYIQEKSIIQSNIRDIENEIKDLKEDIADNKDEDQRLKSRLSRKRKEKKELEEEQRQHELNAKSELFKIGKNNLKKQIKEYLTDGDNSVRDIITEAVDKEKGQNREEMVRLIGGIYDTRMKNKEKIIKSALNKNAKEIKIHYHDYMADIRKLDALKKRIEGEAFND